MALRNTGGGCAARSRDEGQESRAGAGGNHGSRGWHGWKSEGMAQYRGWLRGPRSGGFRLSAISFQPRPRPHSSPGRAAATRMQERAEDRGDGGFRSMGIHERCDGARRSWLSRAPATLPRRVQL